MTFEQEQIVNRLINSGGFVTVECTEDQVNDTLFRGTVKNLLYHGVVLIEFTKTNGEVRVMYATTSEQHGAQHTSAVHLEESSGTNSNVKKPKKQNSETCQVWDTKIGAWRSFRWSNLKKVEFIHK